MFRSALLMAWEILVSPFGQTLMGISMFLTAFTSVIGHLNQERRRRQELQAAIERYERVLEARNQPLSPTVKTASYRVSSIKANRKRGR